MGAVGWFLGAGIFLIPLAWTIVAWRRHRRLQERLYNHICPLCGSSFSESLPRVVGPLTSEQRDRLDHFQRRFAGSSVLCTACGGLVLCSHDGFPMRGYYQTEQV